MADQCHSESGVKQQRPSTKILIRTIDTLCRGGARGSSTVPSCRRVSPPHVPPDAHPFQDERRLDGRPGEKAQGRLRKLTTMRERAC
jgi:hypothetical protein